MRFGIAFLLFCCRFKNSYKSYLCTFRAKYLVQNGQSSLHTADIPYTEITFRDHFMKYKLLIFYALLFLLLETVANKEILGF